VTSRALLEQTYKYLGRTNDLVDFYKNTLKKMPDSVEWNRRAGEFALITGNTEWAEQLYAKAWQNVDKQTEVAKDVFSGYLRSLLSRKKIDRLFEEAGKYVDGDFAPMAFIVMGEAKLTVGDKETAKEYCKKAIDKAGTNENLVVNILRAVYRMFGPEEVTGYCKERLEKNPDSLAANFSMFNVLKINGQYNEALDYIENCLRIAGNDEALNTEYSIQKALVLQVAYMRTSDKKYLEKAIGVYESLLAKMPNNTAVLNNLAYMLTDNNEKLEKALEYAERVYKLEPENVDYLDTYAYTLCKNGKYEKAGEIINSALQRFEGKEMFAPAEMYEHLGMIKEGLSAKDQAVEAYEQALKVGADQLSKETKERISNAIKSLSK
jgi:tetratricopeptide (TPR) repeat protein